MIIFCSFSNAPFVDDSTCDSFRHFKYNYLMFSIFPCFAPLFITSVHPPRAFQMVQKFRKVNIFSSSLFVCYLIRCSNISWYYAELNYEEHFKIGKSRFVFLSIYAEEIGKISVERVSALITVDANKFAIMRLLLSNSGSVWNELFHNFIWC